MIDERSSDYFRRREREERAAAKRAAGAARHIHQQLAQRYAELLHSQKAEIGGGRF